MKLVRLTVDLFMTIALLTVASLDASEVRAKNQEANAVLVVTEFSVADVDADKVGAGGVFSYNIEIFNDSEQNADDVHVNLDLPEGLSFFPSRDPQWTISEGIPARQAYSENVSLVVVDRSALHGTTLTAELTLASSDSDLPPPATAAVIVDSLCEPPSSPASTTWTLDKNCTFDDSKSMPGDVIVPFTPQNCCVLVISPSATLEIDRLNHNIRVSNGAGVLVKNGGKLSLIETPSLPEWFSLSE